MADDCAQIQWIFIDVIFIKYQKNIRGVKERKRIQHRVFIIFLSQKHHSKIASSFLLPLLLLLAGKKESFDLADLFIEISARLPWKEADTQTEASEEKGNVGHMELEGEKEREKSEVLRTTRMILSQIAFTAPLLPSPSPLSSPSLSYFSLSTFLFRSAMDLYSQHFSSPASLPSSLTPSLSLSLLRQHRCYIGLLWAYYESSLKEVRITKEKQKGKEKEKEEQRGEEEKRKRELEKMLVECVLQWCSTFGRLLNDFVATMKRKTGGVEIEIGESDLSDLLDAQKESSLMLSLLQTTFSSLSFYLEEESDCLAILQHKTSLYMCLLGEAEKDEKGNEKSNNILQGFVEALYNLEPLLSLLSPSLSLSLSLEHLGESVGSVLLNILRNSMMVLCVLFSFIAIK